MHEVLFAALNEEKKADLIAQRFNPALDAMSHGLVMLGPTEKWWWPTRKRRM